MIPSRVISILVLVLSGFTCGVWAQRREEFKSYFRIANVPYTENRAEKLNMLDVYMPKKGSRSPVIVWIHGGNWTSGDKNEVDKKPEYFTSKGYIFISVNYRLSPQTNYLGQAQDVATAIVWIHDNIIHYSGDKNRISLIGNGTGAHLAALVTVQDKFLKNASGSLTMVKGVVTVEGAGFDIPTVLPLQEKKFRDGCEAAIGKSRKQWVEASPISHIQSEVKIPPFLIVFAGTKTMAETDAHVLSFRLNRANQASTLKNYPQKNSQNIVRDFGKENDKVTEDIMTFLFECLR
jgi:arylformamidase